MPGPTDANGAHTGRKKQLDEDRKYKCNKCKETLENENVFGCEGGCNGWFHAKCTGMTQGDMKAIEKPSTCLMWICELCRNEKGILEELVRSVKTLTIQFENLRGEIRETVSEGVKEALNHVTESTI